MTIAPVTPAAAPVPTTGAAAGSNSGDFLAVMLDALAAPTPEAPTPDAPTADAPTADAVETVEPVEVPTSGVPTPPDVEPVAAPAGREQNPGKHLGQSLTEHPGLHLGLDHVGHPVNPKHLETAEDPAQDPAQDPAVAADPCPTAAPTLAPTLAPTVDAAVPSTLPVPVAVPAGAPGTNEAAASDDRPESLSENPGAAARPERLDEPARATPATPATPATRATDAAPATPATPATPAVPAAPHAALAAGAPLAAAAAAPLAASTAPVTVNAPTIPDQVFGEITGLVSRGNGTHRITLTLQPEQLGDVRVVLTVRDGAVHVRLAAGDEARAALLEGSPELKQLLERTGATETRIEIRQLPAAAVGAAPATPSSPQHGHQGTFDQPSGQNSGQSSTPTATQTPATDTASAQLAGGDRSPDRHAGTRADHLATDGDDSTRGHRTGGRRDVTPIRSAGTRVAGLDLTL